MGKKKPKRFFAANVSIRIWSEEGEKYRKRNALGNVRDKRRRFDLK